VSRYALSLPKELKREAEALAEQQGVSLNQFILWSVAEKVGDLKRSLDDPNFPNVSYRRGASGFVTPVLRGTGIRIQTIAINAKQWGMNSSRIADEYDLPENFIKEALAFYDAHRTEIDTAILAEEAIELPHA
jgi:uncharacterized protein (DUF433 family)